MRSGRPEPHVLAGAYVMDALDDADRARVERHLIRCEACAREVAGLRETTARLAAARAAAPPAALKDRTLHVVGGTRQLPPRLPVPAPRRLAGVRLAFCQTAPPALPAPPAPHARTVRQHRARRPAVPARAAALLTASSAAVLAAVLAVVLVVTAGPAARRPATALPGGGTADAVAAIVTARDATMLTGRVATGGRAMIVMSGRRHALVFTAAGLRRLPSSRCYELWVMGPDGDRAAGRLPAARHGMTGPVIAAGLRAGDQLGLSVEPGRGAGHPTGRMLLVLAL
ncbi:MAG: anti-sigma factor domain-containing protein [Streptosporangiaceae bacterium]